jgi:hypothetical protein
MAKIFMPDVSPEERLNIMRNHADEVEKSDYEKELTEDELAAKKDQFLKNDIVISNLEDELSDKKKEIKSKMDPLKVKNKGLRYEVKTGKKKCHGDLYHMADHTNSKMETYDATGELIFSRRLRPDEKQPTKLFVPKPAANE